MTKLTKNTENRMHNEDYFSLLIQGLKPHYLSDISWVYSYTTETVCIEFYQDQNGKNYVEQFAVKIKNKWSDVNPTDFQIKVIFEKLNATPYRQVETFTPIPWEDEMTENGHQQKDFY